MEGLVKIITLTSENVKRLVAVEIKPDGNLVQITGKNGQGKTSVLDSIWWCIAGAKHIQSAPIRKGANQARIKLDLGEIVVTRTFKRTGEGDDFATKLEVVGAVKGTPQGMLDSLLDALAFDPLAFARMAPKDQFTAIKKYVPDVDFDKLAAQNSIDFSTRTDVSRRAKEARILADQIVIDPKSPTEIVDESALVKQLSEAGRHNSETQLRAERRTQEVRSIRDLLSDAVALRQKAATIIQEAAQAEKDAADRQARFDAADPLPALIDVAVLEAGIASAKKANEEVAKRQRKAEHNKTALKFDADAKALTERMAARDAEKLASIAKAKLPVESLSFGDGIVLLNGVPFDQASDAEQLKASCALAMAGNPELRVLRVRDGSLLDEESLALLGKMADERDYQVWIERVTSGEKIGFELLDGSLIEHEKKEAQQTLLPEEK